MPGAACDVVVLGEVMLRLDPGDYRVNTTRSFRVSEGGGEYNVARAASRSFGLTSTIVTALVDNPVGRLIEDLMLQGGVDTSNVRWLPFDGVGRSARNGLNFTERGFGLRPARGCYDRGHSAASQLAPGEIDWQATVGQPGTRWFHTGGVFASLSKASAAVALEGVVAARQQGVTVSYDLNYRPSLWKSIGGQRRAQQVNDAIVSHVDVLFGNEEDFTAALGFEVDGVDDQLSQLEPESFGRMIDRVVKRYPNLRYVGTSLRTARSATRNDWGGILWHDGEVYQAPMRHDLEIFDRVGGGDSFASGVIYGLMTGESPRVAVELGAAHGALAMTTPGDVSMVTLSEIRTAMNAVTVRVDR
jgi:2-dehydro-3-deoxygluconokinase